MANDMNIPIWVIIIVLIILILAFSNQIIYLLNSAKNEVVSIFSYKDNKKMNCDIQDDDDTERLQSNNPKDNSANTYQPQTSDSLLALGYTGSLPWDEVIQVSELDPATFTNHEEFVKDVRRFSSGANFTSVTDDNTNLAFVNFVGLRRPESVNIGPGARQIPDIDENVLKRNQVFRWNSTS